MGRRRRTSAGLDQLGATADQSKMRAVMRRRCVGPSGLTRPGTYQAPTDEGAARLAAFRERHGIKKLTEVEKRVRDLVNSDKARQVCSKSRKAPSLPNIVMPMAGED